jgi:transcriptional regulator with XRE-family HTH domain
VAAWNGKGHRSGWLRWAVPALLALGTAIRALRKARGISQEELAHRSHIDRSYMSSIERGMQNPGVMTVVQIASRIGVSVAELAAKARL